MKNVLAFLKTIGIETTDVVHNPSFSDLRESELLSSNSCFEVGYQAKVVQLMF